MRRLFLSTMALLMLWSCGENEAQKQAEAMLEKAGTCFEQGQYNQALIVIDSLRKVYPNAIDTRKKALKLYQDIELKKTQQELLVTDSLLQAVNHDMKRDSLRTQTEVLGAKIRYIHKKQKEMK